jgi:uncharacterized membrane protein
VRRLAH